MGPATATLIISCAKAVVDRAKDAPNARPMSFIDFIGCPRGVLWGKCRIESRAPFSADFAAKSPGNFGQSIVGLQHLAAGRAWIGIAQR
jgi:hypothetical protein